MEERDHVTSRYVTIYRVTIDRDTNLTVQIGEIKKKKNRDYQVV